MNILGKLFKKRLCRHRNREFVSFQKDGKITFCFNCARPTRTHIEACADCGKRFVTGGWIVPDNDALELTPDVAARLLRDDFGHR